MHPTVTILLACLAACALAQAPATQPSEAKLPHLEVNPAGRQVRVQCQTLLPDMPLEFLLCAAETKEYESLLRTSARPSHLHMALLLIGLKPGLPAHTDEATGKRLAPQGPEVRLTCQWQVEGRTVSVPAGALLRNRKTDKEMGPATWVFCGSRLTADGQYMADVSGEIISLVNMPYAVLDVPGLASNRNEDLEWIPNQAQVPPRGTTVWLIIEPALPPGGP
jgi:hypothetical protein